MNAKMRIMLSAVKIRLRREEELEAILASYPRLKEEERELLRSEVKK